MSHITSHSFPTVVNRHTFSEEDTTRLEVMLQAIPAIRHKEIVRRTNTKFHIVDLEDGVTKEMDTADYVMNAKLNGKVKDLYRKCPAHHGHFDFDEFLEGNMLALMAIAPRRAENQALILIDQIKVNCIDGESKKLKADEIRRSSEIVELCKIFPDSIVAPIVFLYELYRSFLPTATEQEELENALSRYE
eukprot:Awhi_evm1s2788